MTEQRGDPFIMNTETRPISEINRRATQILFEEMGVVDTIRFLNQFSIGQGDYTKEREKWLGDISLDDAISQIKAESKKPQPQKIETAPDKVINYFRVRIRFYPGPD